jgi:hypothetical protein
LLPEIVTGGLLSVVCAVATGQLIVPGTALPRAVRFATGATAFSLVVFVTLLCHAGYPGVYAALAVALAVLAFRTQAAVTERLAPVPWFFRAVFAVAGVAYLVNALAPEIQADAAGYHLRLVSDYVRLHGFSHRVGFFDALPQGMEMLFVPAFAVGAGSAAKLVHFAFLLATIPLIREIAREAGLANLNGCAAAAIFFLAPVCAVDGTSAYTDIGLVCACCALVYLLMRWERERRFALLVCAALNAAFCYAVKPNFGWVAITAFAYVRFSPAFAGMTLLFSAPWLVRSLRLRDVVTPDLLKDLSMHYGAFRPSFAWHSAWLDYTVSGGNQGFFGPAFLLLPLGLWAMRSKWGRALCVTGCVLAAPFLVNTGARFLMPSMAIGAVALASVVPGSVAIGLVAAQVVGAVYDRRDWRLEDLPVRAALRITPEPQYLATRIGDFGMVDEIARAVPSGAKVFSCVGLPEAYIDREVLGFWHSKQARRMTDALQFALVSHGTSAQLLSWRWRESPGTAMRVTALSEVQGSSGNGWRVYKPGESMGLGLAAGLRGADFLVWPGDSGRVRAEVLSPSGEWCNVDASASRFGYRMDIRADATASVRRSGYGYLVMPVADDAFAPMGSDMLRHAEAWRVEVVGRSGNLYLFRIQGD